MKLYAKYVSLVYLKYFFILFVALDFFYVGIDVLTNLKDFPQSANTGLLYVALTAGVAITYILPLSLIFALIIMIFNMIRSSELISFYALGVSKNALIIPPFLISLFITLGYIYLNTTPFAYALKFQKNLTDFTPVGPEMFLKYEGKYVYINGLHQNHADEMIAFDINASELQSRIWAKNGEYSAKEWKFREGEKTQIPTNLSLGEAGLKRESIQNEAMLRGFNPSSIESVYDTSNVYSIKDAIRSIKTFANQGVNVNSIKANLYNMIFFPLFAPIMILILYYYFPITGRFFNLALMSFGFFIITLCAWGLFFVLIRFSLNGVILPELGIIVPILLLLVFAIWLVFKHR
ncbi:LptF/LptG family permease [Campylobacter sp. JMF_01 NE2]|uniref:LptF/LptG family permease n=1 Tax=unclassified Campylobacter TaxID=2593542 RepID=UPI0022E9B357|nr:MULTISPECIES: LptF/LptG family permease [unclassified Campylobacter]MDA3043714.1 LptF/LptG family permease [Campylobacter sp. JMF_09 ED2]MDA3045335.1 LptF/LptG family permease [Campylobacter sp. JMF_07 ED4]MDA3048107.1 LptF/LptG family permease [Campylobacter sp. JMF_08 NE1]MDA3053403.1 LptF/LptG family permease [Campylobacter sp. JMF_03 NE3]MDA3062107.1 LptF/LptG family permease [Campylobacter sp. JMF_14 EL1]